MARREYHVELVAHIELLEQRLARIETRLVQLMIHMKLDPYRKVYAGATYHQHSGSSHPGTPSGSVSADIEGNR